MTDKQFTDKYINLTKTFYELSRCEEDCNTLEDIESKLKSSNITGIVFDEEHDSGVNVYFNDKNIHNIIKNNFSEIKNKVKNQRNSILEKYINEIKNY